MPRPEVMRHMLAGENLALITPKQHKSEFGAYVTTCIGGHKTVAAFDINYYFPLYLYLNNDDLDSVHRKRQANLADWLLPKLTEAYGFRPTPEEVVAYIYAVLYSPTYREKYAEELRVDFPRVPFTAKANVFRQMAALGQELIDLHLLRKTSKKPGVKYQGKDSDQIAFVRYDPASGRVTINQDKYFEGITPPMWAYQIGGYQVLEKYLKDRKGRLMDDPVRYIHIAAAIARTLEVQDQIAQVYALIETNVLQ
jgi:predicted helicase